MRPPAPKTVKAIHELAKNILREFRRARQERRALSHRFAIIESDSEFTECVDMLRGCYPSLDQVSIGLEVKLKSIHVIVKAKRLEAAGVRLRQMYRSVRQRKGV